MRLSDKGGFNIVTPLSPKMGKVFLFNYIEHSFRMKQIINVILFSLSSDNLQDCVY
eukprot:m.12862 g.12862  ORF g.12862 m.12862 type:complete len:56 (-) comp4072_c0_seq1:293-460(-)